MINREKFAELSIEEKHILGNTVFYPEWEGDNDPDESLIHELTKVWSGVGFKEHKGGVDRFIEIVKKL